MRSSSRWLNLVDKFARAPFDSLPGRAVECVLCVFVFMHLYTRACIVWVYTHICVSVHQALYLFVLSTNLRKRSPTVCQAVPAPFNQPLTGLNHTPPVLCCFVPHTLSPACCEKAKITMLCLTTPAWMQTDPHSTCGGLDDSLTEKRRDSHIFPGPEIHYTVTRTARTVMVNMFRNTETLEQTNQGKQYLSMTTTFLLLNQVYAPHPT